MRRVRRVRVSRRWATALITAIALVVAVSDSTAFGGEPPTLSAVLSDPSTITYTASHFAPSSTVKVTADFAGAPFTSETQTNSAGLTSGTFAVPTGFVGTVELTAKGKRRKEAQTAVDPAATPRPSPTATAAPSTPTTVLNTLATRPTSSPTTISKTPTTLSAPTTLASTPDGGTGYNAAVLADKPVLFLDLAGSSGGEKDLSGNGNDGTYVGGNPGSAKLPNGDGASVFDGAGTYLTVASNPALSIPTTGELTWEGWIQPTTLQFGSDYVNWMGKCEQYSPTCEWEARLYSTSNPQDRCNRFSAYVFNPSAGLGSGADWQPACGLVKQGQWFHVVGQYSTKDTPSGCSASTPGKIDIWVNGVKWDQSSHGDTGCMSQYNVTPKANGSALNVGRMASEYAFPGAVGKVAVYDHLLSDERIAAHFEAMTNQAPSGNCGDTCTTKPVS